MIDDETRAIADELASLWAGPPEGRAQVMPRLAEMPRFGAIVVVLDMVQLLQGMARDGHLIDDLIAALQDAERRYSQ